MADEPVGPANSADELFDPERQVEILEAPPKTNDRDALDKKALTDKQKGLQEENDLRAVLSTEEGVRVMARLIGGPCGWNLPYFHADQAVMCEISGRRSIGYQLEQWICDCDLSLWFKVRQELEKQRPKPPKVKKPSVPVSTDR